MPSSSRKKVSPRRPPAAPRAAKPAAKPKAKAPVRPAPPKKAAPPAKPAKPTKPASTKPTPPAPMPEVRRGDGRRHLLSLAFLRDGDEFLARLETDAGQITELKNRSLDQLLSLVAGELEDLLE